LCFVCNPGLILTDLFCQNFNLYSGLKPSQTKKAITFVGHGDGVSQTYSVRLQSEEQAAKLKEALEKEIVLVKSSAE
jgi:nucleoporin NUP2